MPLELRILLPRRWVAQIVLCAMLLGALALAAWVSRQRVQALQVPLDGPRHIETAGILACLPREWTVRNDSPDGITAEEPGSSRKLHLSRRQSRRLHSPVEYLRAVGLLAMGEGDPRPRIAAITVDGWPGLLVSATHYVRPIGEPDPQVHRTTSAVVVLPSGEIVTIGSSAPGRADASDGDLVRRVVESVKLRGTAAPVSRAGPRQIADNIRLSVPKAMFEAGSPDAYRNGVRLIGSGPGWLGVELVACDFPPGSGAVDFATILACRGRAVAMANMERRPPNLWVYREGEPGLSARTTYLLVNGDGQALLADFLADGEAGAGVEGLWKEIASSVEFAPQSDLAARLQRGAEAARRYRSNPEALLGWAVGKERWLWYERGPASQQRWTVVEWSRSAPWTHGLQSTELLQLDRSRRRVTASYRASGPLGSYGYRMPADPEQAADQETRLHGGRLTFAGSSHSAEAAAVPENYVPGPLLGYLLAQVGESGLILRTESCVAVEGVAVPGPLLLRVDPSVDCPRSTASGARPMRCLAVRVNGTGETTRWYFNDAGELQYIDFAGGTHLQRERVD